MVGSQLRRKRGGGLALTLVTLAVAGLHRLPSPPRHALRKDNAPKFPRPLATGKTDNVKEGTL